MGVPIHEPGRQSGVPQVDHLRVGRHRQIAAGIHDLVSLHEHDAVRNQGFRLAVE